MIYDFEEMQKLVMKDCLKKAFVKDSLPGSNDMFDRLLDKISDADRTATQQKSYSNSN